jgi:hypothetical protein
MVLNMELKKLAFVVLAALVFVVGIYLYVVYIAAGQL